MKIALNSLTISLSLLTAAVSGAQALAQPVQESVASGLLASDPNFAASLTPSAACLNSDSMVQVTADAWGLTRLDTLPATPGSVYWVAVGGNILLPYPIVPPETSGLTIAAAYEILPGSFLLDATGGQVVTRRNVSLTDALLNQANAIDALINQVQAGAASAALTLPAGQTMQALGGALALGGAGGGSVAMPKGGSYNNAPDFGTNLWVGITGTGLRNGVLSGFASNTIADNPYSLLVCPDLVMGSWRVAGTLYGSEATNWTPWSLFGSNATNLFVRLRSETDSSGTGIPDWWWAMYGLSDQNPYGNPSGDGYSNLQKYQGNMNPNKFYTPPAPTGLTVDYRSASGAAKIYWQPSPGAVTGYTVKDNQGNSNNAASPQVNLTVPYAPVNEPPYYMGSPATPNLSQTYQVQAHYAGGASAWSAPVALQTPTVSGYFAPDGTGGTALHVVHLPANAVAVRLFLAFTGYYYHLSNNDLEPYLVTNWYTVPVARLVNGACPADAAWGQANPAVPPGCILYNAQRALYLQAVDGAGNVSAGTPVAENWALADWHDGRVALKQNLIFQLRAASTVAPFQTLVDGHHNFNPTSIPTHYVWAGLYDVNNTNSYYGRTDDMAHLNLHLPFQDNTLYRNLVYDATEMSADGLPTTGLGWDAYDSDYCRAMGLFSPLTYVPTTNDPAPRLDTARTNWLGMYAMGMSYDAANGFSFDWLDDRYQITFNGGTNYWGLPLVSAQVYYWNYDQNYDMGTLYHTVLTPGASLPGNYNYPTAIYVATAVPEFRPLGYNFWFSDWGWHMSALTNIPGLSGFSTNRASDLLLTSVGTVESLAAYAKLGLTNGRSDMVAYLGQYLDKAYRVDDAGKTTTNVMGITSPHGEYWATEAGIADLVTLPDVDTQERGTGRVYVVGLVMDKNQDGVMDGSMFGPDATSPDSPMTFWVNNNYDRGHAVDGSDYEQDDLTQKEIAGLSAPQRVPDSEYRDAAGRRVIPCTRDLQDYARLWIRGIDTNLLKALPPGSTVGLYWDNGVPNTNPTIDVFQAVEPDGGTNYLFDAVTASNQVAQSAALYVGRLGPNHGLTLDARSFANGGKFIWCGVQPGQGTLHLLLPNGQGGWLSARAWLEVRDIKDMYERWTVGDNPTNTPWTQAVPAVNNAPNPQNPIAFRYPPNTDTNTPYILHVHGWNMEEWEKDRYAETAYKRLYWQGYQGRFGSFRWPTGSGINSKTDAILDHKNFDRSESNAWASATGLLNKLKDLNTQYPGKVYLTAHSMGNVVAGEALRLAGNQQVVNTYIAMQGAVPAHAYDSNTPIRSLPDPDPGTPDSYAHYWMATSPCYFNASAGAGTYVNFFNTNDWALDKWQTDQNWKPDVGFTFYANSGNFYRGTVFLNQLFFPTNTYELFSFCVPARCYALGEQANVGGVFDPAKQIDLQTIWPLDTHPHEPEIFYSAHVWHSAEFRSDNSKQANFWNTVLGTRGFNLK